MGRLSKRQIVGATNATKKKKVEPDFQDVSESSLDDGDSSADIVSDDAYDVLITAVSNVIHKSRRICLKNSRTTKWRRKKDSAGSLKITSFFRTIPPDTSANYDEQSGQSIQDTDNDADDELEGAYCEEVWFGDGREEEEDNLVISRRSNRLLPHDVPHHTALHVDGDIPDATGQQEHLTQTLDQMELDAFVKPEPEVDGIDKDMPGWQLFDNADAVNAEATDSPGTNLHSSSPDEVSEQEQHLQDLSSRIQRLAAHLAKVKHTNRISCFQYLQYMSVLRYLKLVREEGVCRLPASKIVANALLQWDAGIEWKAKTIRRWSKHWCRYGKLPQSCRGKHQKTKSYIEDEDVQQRCLEWIRLQRGEITSRFIFNFIFFIRYIYST
jgi:hypothetical protein